MRFYPGDEPAEPLPRHRATVEIPTTGDTPVIAVVVTARTPHLVHVTWIDDTGETMALGAPPVW